MTTFTLAAWLIAVMAIAAPALSIAAPPAGTVVASPAPPEVVAEIRATVESARQRFEARDASGVLGYVSDRYRSQGLTKAALREQLLAMFALYDELRCQLTVDQVQIVGGAVWIYTTGSVSGRLPLMGRVTVLSWAREPEVARREGSVWRLHGFQD